MSNIKIDLPIIPLRKMTILPGMTIHFDISRKKSIKAVESAMANNQKLFLVAQVDSQVSEPTVDDIYKVGTIAKIKQIVKMPNTLVRVLVEGVERGCLNKIIQDEDMLVGKVAIMGMEPEDRDESTDMAMVLQLHDTVKEYAAANPKCNKDIIKMILGQDKLEALLVRIAADMPFDYTEKQQILEAGTNEERFNDIMALLLKHTEIHRIKNDLMQKVRDKVDKNQKDYVIREQLKVLHEELSEEDYESESEEFYKRIEQLKASEEVKNNLRKEVKRYNAMSSSSSEANVIRNYIQTCLDVPWGIATEDNYSLGAVIEQLDKDHYGLKKVKERIVEYLAVRMATGKTPSSIICLVGPPGTGKTSIVKSIANALGKEYVRICLGGVRDEAEIRGHRKTYIGAMPGRIVKGITQAGAVNPVMLLDEIDKMSSDYRGDTASAMLEVLDSEQNSAFVDHYLEMPLDLSQVMFIATANDMSAIPGPLLDRMEVIEINSYTENEKFHIAKEYLVKKQMDKNGVKKGQLSISDKAIISLIQFYTREAGVRELERCIGTICRKAVKQRIVDGTKGAVKVNDRNISEYLGKKKYERDRINSTPQVGIVRGLAWTCVGGDTLQIEVNTYPGNGELKLTGQMGEVMRESAMIALSCARAVTAHKPYKAQEGFFDVNVFHLHIPQGAVPKDGPSAGITMTTAFVSAATGFKVRQNVAMTGEITLRGQVLAIGGLKEKMLAAKNAGAQIVIVPKKNYKDVCEFEEEITGGLDIKYVENIRQVLDIALISKE